MSKNPEKIITTVESEICSLTPATSNGDIRLVITMRPYSDSFEPVDYSISGEQAIRLYRDLKRLIGKSPLMKKALKDAGKESNFVESTTWENKNA